MALGLPQQGMVLHWIYLLDIDHQLCGNRASGLVGEAKRK